MLVDLEGHGREAELAGDADLSRTVGWFTSVIPVRLDPGAVDLADDRRRRALDQALARVRERLAAPPVSGVGHGLLRHLNPATGPELAALGGPQSSSTTWAVSTSRRRPTGRTAPAEDNAAELDGDPGMPISHALTVNALTEDRPKDRSSAPTGRTPPECSPNRPYRTWPRPGSAHWRLWCRWQQKSSSKGRHRIFPSAFSLGVTTLPKKWAESPDLWRARPCLS